MRKVLLIMIILTLAATSVFAQGRVAVFGDPAGTSCSLTDVGGFLVFYVYHIGAAGATAVEYKAELPLCYDGSWIGDFKPFPVSPGDSQTGISVAYGGCLNGDIETVRVQTIANGGTPTCCVYPITPGPNGPVRFTDCSSPFPVKIELPGQSGLINEGAPASGCECADIVPTKNSTWGGIKSMWNYNNR